MNGFTLMNLFARLNSRLDDLAASTFQPRPSWDDAARNEFMFLSILNQEQPKRLVPDQLRKEATNVSKD